MTQGADLDPDAADLRAIEALEALRCGYISAGDMAGLRSLLTDDYRHCHAMGRTDAVDDAVESFRRSPRVCRRIDPFIRQIGDVAIVTGVQENIFGHGKEVKVGYMQVTTVLRRIAGEWKFMSFHGCNIP